jgi:hypothetical protein
MKALTIRQPWAWAVFHAEPPKDVENRDWRTDYRGPLVIHAAKGMTREEYHSFWEFYGFARLASGAADSVLNLPAYEDLARGAIIGVVELADCVRSHHSPWFQGEYGFVLQNPRPLARPIATAGALKLWDVPPHVEAQIDSQLAGRGAP